MSTIPLNARSIAFSVAGQPCALEFEDEYLTCSLHDGPTFSVTRTPLRRIMPDLVVDRSLPRAYQSYGSVARFSLAGGVIVWFSDLRPHVPLLAPALFLCTAYSVYRIVRAISPLEKSKVLSEWGEEIAIIPHHDVIADQRQSFEEALVRAVREARRKFEED